MRPSRFPDPRRIRGDIVAIGDDLRPETLVDAYRHGIFPWPVEDFILPWFSPVRRAILEIDSIHLSRSLRRSIRRSTLSFTIDRDFEGVIRGCAAADRPGQEGTWIFPEVVDAYIELHRLGVAHSVEAWEEGELVGGIYGVDAGGAFTGESMFHRRSDASKMALIHLGQHLESRGLDWIDIQVMTPHMEALGATTIRRNAFLERLAATQARGLVLF
jgi:leucyl/phenylalanyl-tRNA---protein transferase